MDIVKEIQLMIVKRYSKRSPAKNSNKGYVCIFVVIFISNFFIFHFILGNSAMDSLIFPLRRARDVGFRRKEEG